MSSAESNGFICPTFATILALHGGHEMTEQTSDERFEDFIVGMRQLAGEITEERNTELDEDRWNKKERQIISLENAANLLDEA
jgi:hypothetical protein